MSANPPPVPSPRRCGLLTVVAWLFIVAGGLLLPISAISLLMILAGSDGTGSVTAGGFFSVVVAPPLAVATGIGLLRRWAWAWWVAVLLLGIVIAQCVAQRLARRPADESFLSPSGVRTTVLASPPDYHSVPIVAVAAVMMAMLLGRRVRSQFGRARQAVASPAGKAKPTGRPDPARGWRVGHQGRDGMYYEERHGVRWRRIGIEGEMLTGRAHHVIYFASPEQWQRYPAWARGRREEIIGRIQSEFRPPDYEYAPGGGVPAARPAVAAARATPPQWGALALVVAILLAIAGGMGWLVTSGLERGTTWFPAKRASQQRVVTRQAEPVTFRLALGVYAVIGLGAGGLALWMTGVAVRR